MWLSKTLSVAHNTLSHGASNILEPPITSVMSPSHTPLAPLHQCGQWHLLKLLTPTTGFDCLDCVSQSSEASQRVDLGGRLLNFLSYFSIVISLPIVIVDLYRTALLHIKLAELFILVILLDSRTFQHPSDGSLPYPKALTSLRVILIYSKIMAFGLFYRVFLPPLIKSSPWIMSSP